MSVDKNDRQSTTYTLSWGQWKTDQSEYNTFEAKAHAQYAGVIFDGGNLSSLEAAS